jgi:hypothetical protein
MGYNGATGVIKHSNWTRFYDGVSRWGNPLAMLDDTGRLEDFPNELAML